MKSLIIGLIALFSVSAYAEEYLVANIKAWHVNSTYTYNEENWGAGYAWDTESYYLGKIQPQIGFYRTSEYTQTSYAAYATITKYFWQSNDKVIQLGGTVGMAMGYSNGFFRPIVAGVLTLNVPVNNKPVAINTAVSVYKDQSEFYGTGGRIKPLIAMQVAVPFSSF